MRIVYSNELYHHGIKGMKWGVRRIENKDGTRTTAGKNRSSLVGKLREHKQEKAKKKLAKAIEKQRLAKLRELRGNIISSATDYGDQFTKTDSYKKLRKEYDTAYDAYFTNNDESKTAEKRFAKAEEKMLRAGMNFEAHKLYNEYGRENMSSYLTNGRNLNMTKEEIIKKYEDMWYIHAE